MAWYWPSSLTASMACCTMATAFCATRSVTWRRRAERSAGEAVVGEGLGIGDTGTKEKRAPKDALFFLALYFQNSTLKRKLCHTLHKFIRLVCNHLVHNWPSEPLDKSFPQARLEAGLITHLPEKSLKRGPEPREIRGKWSGGRSEGAPPPHPESIPGR